MAAPTSYDFSTPMAPAGKPLERGHQSLVAFGNMAGSPAGTTPKFWSKSITPPALEGGDPIDITTQHNTTWKTKVPRSLKDLEEFSFTAAYDPDIFAHDDSDQLVAAINDPTTVSILFSDGSTLAFYGYIRRVEPSELAEEADQPEVTMTVVPTNWDYVNDVEAGPVMVEVSGT